VRPGRHAGGETRAKACPPKHPSPEAVIPGPFRGEKLHTLGSSGRYFMPNWLRLSAGTGPLLLPGKGVGGGERGRGRGIFHAFPPSGMLEVCLPSPLALGSLPSMAGGHSCQCKLRNVTDPWLCAPSPNPKRLGRSNPARCKHQAPQHAARSTRRKQAASHSRQPTSRREMVLYAQGWQTDPICFAVDPRLTLAFRGSSTARPIASHNAVSAVSSSHQKE
jgi:hypothetical protein